MNKIIDIASKINLFLRAVISVSAKDFRNSHLCRKWRNFERYIWWKETGLYFLPRRIRAM